MTSRNTLINKLESVNEQIKKCVDICNKHDLDYKSFNLTDNHKEIKESIEWIRDNPSKELPKGITVKVMNDSLKYYKGVEQKLLYINLLKQKLN